MVGFLGGGGILYVFNNVLEKAINTNENTHMFHYVSLEIVLTENLRCLKSINNLIKSKVTHFCVVIIKKFF